MDKKAAAMHEATDIGTKLTEAQKRLLIELGGARTRQHLWSGHKPVQKLHALGLIDQEESRYGGFTYAITEAGRSLLRSLQEKSHG